MPPTTYLHIESRGEGPARMLALEGDEARIGRAAECEVRLEGGSLAEVQCELHRDGPVWVVRPVGPKGRVSVDGIPVDRSRAWAIGSTLRVGDFDLTWREAGVGPIDDGVAVVPDAVEPATPEEPSPGSERSDRSAVEQERLARWQSSLERRERWLQARKEEARWERRWRAAGERLRARSGAGADPASPTSPVDPIRPAPPSSPPRARRSSPEAGPAEESRVIRPAPEGAGPPKLGSVSRLEPDRPAAQADPVPAIRAAPRLDPDHLAARLAWEGSTAEPTIEVDLAPEPEPVEAEPPEWPRPEVESPGHQRVALPSPAPAPSQPTKIDRLMDEPTWPTVRSILEAQREVSRAPSASGSSARSKVSRRGLTESRAPSEWSLPAPLVAPPAIALALVLGVLAIALAWQWGQDDRIASALGDAVLAGGPLPPGGIASEPLPSANWWGTTADHLMLQAAALGSADGEATRRERTEFLVGLAANAAPANAGARLALSGEAARFGRSLPPASRDAVSLGLAARQRLAEGRSDEGLSLAREALALAADAEPSASRSPEFLDESGVKRYRLPNEDLFEPIVEELSRVPDWTFAEWSSALPETAVAWIAAYRVLRAAGAPGAEGVLEEIVARPEPEADALGAVELAARAEALAFLSRWPEAESAYREAIPKAPGDDWRRAWWLNLAEIYERMYEPGRAREARAAAWGVEVASLRPDEDEAADPEAASEVTGESSP